MAKRPKEMRDNERLKTECAYHFPYHILQLSSSSFFENDILQLSSESIKMMLDNNKVAASL